MSIFRRAVVLVTTAVVAASSLMSVTGTPVSASSNTWAVTITGTYSPVIDDDSTIFGTSLTYAPASYFTRTYYVSPIVPVVNGPEVWSACAGGEVTGEMRPQITLGSGSGVHVSMQFRLHEGYSCQSSDVDGLRLFGAFSLWDGQSATHLLKVGNTSEGGLDSATLTFTATATLVK